MKRCFHALLACAIIGCGDTTSPVPVATVVVTATTSTLHSVTETTTLTAVARDASGADIPGATFTWTTSNISIASIVVNQGGGCTATAGGNGDVLITATSGGVSGTTFLHVTQTVASVVVTPPSTTLLSITETVQLVATAKDALGQKVSNAPAPQWSGSSPTAVSVSSTGLATALANGASTVTATIGGISGTATVTVTQTPASIVFIAPPVSTKAGAPIAPITVAVRDAKGQTVKSATNLASISINDNPGGGALGGTIDATPVNGVATFSGLSIDQLGTGYSLFVFMQPPVQSAPPLTATSPAFDVVTYDAQLDSLHFASNVISLSGNRTVAYTVFARNATGQNMTGLFVQSTLHQGTTVASTGGTSLFGCGGGAGVLSPGVCAMQSGSNIVGVGGFVAGPAVLFLTFQDQTHLYTTIQANVILQ